MLIGNDGRFSGYASVFGVADQVGDIVMPGAFSESLKRRGADRIRLLFQHDPKEPIGRFERIEEDARGLLVRGQLFADVRRSADLITLVSGGALDGLSIGFRAERATRDPDTKHRRLWRIDLWEISIVTFPMMERARIHPVPPTYSAKEEGRTVLSPNLRDRLARAASLCRNP